VNCSTLYKEGCLGLIIFVCYSWEVMLNVAVDASTKDLMILQDKGRKANSTVVNCFCYILLLYIIRVIRCVD
jgi:hypothetical protein